MRNHCETDDDGCSRRGNDVVSRQLVAAELRFPYGRYNDTSRIIEEAVEAGLYRERA
jgi:hypothetical protein